jgi:uncharacterized protein
MKFTATIDKLLKKLTSRFSDQACFCDLEKDLMALSRDDHLFGRGPKRILSLDGGGVRGLITLGMLTKVERLLKARSPDPESFRLCDYFDLIGGTSTGALIATLLALGYNVADIVTLYTSVAPNVFRHRRLFAGIQSKFDSVAFKKAVDATLGDFLKRNKLEPADGDLLCMDSQFLRTGLALVCKRIDTGSVWVLVNNPKAKYWDPDSELWKLHLTEQKSLEFYPNKNYPLATIVRASASAPYYLDGVDLQISPEEVGHFLDGGASPCNNPCQELFLMTTLRDHEKTWNKDGVSPFGFDWKTGPEHLFMLSLGTGTFRKKISPTEFKKKPALGKAGHALLGIIGDADKSATMFMQSISECPARPQHRIDGNLLEMHGLRIVNEPLLTFRRVNVFLDRDWLRNLSSDFDFSEAILTHLREMDRADKINLERLWRIGLESGEKLISEQDFPATFDLTTFPPAVHGTKRKQMVI